MNFFETELVATAGNVQCAGDIDVVHQLLERAPGAAYDFKLLARAQRLKCTRLLPLLIMLARSVELSCSRLKIRYSESPDWTVTVRRSGAVRRETSDFASRVCTSLIRAPRCCRRQVLRRRVQNA